ncbi:MAG: signal recognition particle-docking protein FtsY [Clostridia bacterium]
MGFFDSLKKGLNKTRTNFVGKINNLVSGYKIINEDFYEELEEILIGADVGVQTSLKLIEKLHLIEKAKRIESTEEIQKELQGLMEEILNNNAKPMNLVDGRVNFILIAGVNGVGKTTTAGKLAYHYVQAGKKVLLVAGDTFRAAAREQLAIWAERANCSFLSQEEGTDPAAIAHDAVQMAIARKIDVVIMDTAGRLHNKINLMEEMKKIRRVVARELSGGPHETMLVLDATTGQNAVEQAKIFHEALELTSIALTKLDGTAKGGIVISIGDQLGIPVKFIGVGEQAKDLDEFEAEMFSKALFNE